MKSHFLIILSTLILSFCLDSKVMAAAQILNPGEAYGQLVVLSQNDIINESPKYKNLNALSIPVFEELPKDLGVVAGAITLKQQNLVSHIQLKCRARHTPNLDISHLESGLKNSLFHGFTEGAWIHMLLQTPEQILITSSTEAEANAFYEQKKTSVMKLDYDLSATNIFKTEQLGSADSIRVGSKAANYAQLLKIENTPGKIVVRPGYALPFYYYDEFIRLNPKVQQMIESILKDPLMNKVAKVSYREDKLNALQNLMTSEDAIMNEKLVNDLFILLDADRNTDDLPYKWRLRSSTNSEDLPNFNGAGLYTSVGYKPTKKSNELSETEKKNRLREALKTVWASVWNLRAFDERNYFQIPHADVKMGIQMNPAFNTQDAEGVVITKNITENHEYPETSIFIEAQRGNTYSVMNPDPGVKPEKILVSFNTNDPLNVDEYEIHILQKSNIDDDEETILQHDNPKPVLKDKYIKDIVYYSLKAQMGLKPLLDPNNDSFSLDIEFKVDVNDSGKNQVFLKQARPYLN